ncbi:hypothetical protein Htur_3391 [Haloterrigena turkmenica DSM 5511]|uniref:Uncharacterized protein n=1 Tax=Haloterrigena turkmenica (strain ATCC 51198 / DSM 5511 / JCM 9101 / NCIMB 13204 / VKM B-1734 / 4k) TaxID=543526 RepID=D2RPV2_HALTV|nr:hypothetical protein [Haloterrigena turkmenica]ADB62254.1 hypothetical protein Htur_3391 [Haloterrigena turkmenica DSM 5511]
MTHGLEPTEEYDGSITVRLLDDESGTEEIRCSSYEDAIDRVKECQHAVTAAKIVAGDGSVVFTSADMDIDDWERVWRREKRRQSVQVEDHDCPHDSVSCFADDLCVQCQIDNVRDEY